MLIMALTVIYTTYKSIKRVLTWLVYKEGCIVSVYHSSKVLMDIQFHIPVIGIKIKLSKFNMAISILRPI